MADDEPMESGDKIATRWKRNDRGLADSAGWSMTTA
jgi:hypothetical protein